MDALMMTLAAAQAGTTTAPAIRNPRGDADVARRARYRAAPVTCTAGRVETLLGSNPPSPGRRPAALTRGTC